MKKVSESVGFIIHFMASRSCVAGLFQNYQESRKIQNLFLTSHKFTINAARLHVAGVETFLGSSSVSIGPHKDNVSSVPLR